MENVWRIFGFYVGLEILDLCSGFPIGLHSPGAVDLTPWTTLTPFLAVAFLVTSAVFLVGCICCRQNKGFQPKERKIIKEFTDTTSNHSLSNTGGYVNTATSNAEFTMFPPGTAPGPPSAARLSVPGVAGSERSSMVRFEPLPDIRPPQGHGKRPAAFNNAATHGLTAKDWFQDPHVNFPRHQLKYLKEVGRGWFGQVVEGEAQGIIPDEKTSNVVVKILHEDATTADHMYFLHEVKHYRDLKHPNVLGMLGQCLETDPFLVLLEACPGGDLKSFLSTNVATADALNEQGVTLLMACNIASGLQHMLEKGFIHTDLAARNCLVTPDLTVKIGDYGTNIENFKEEYYCAGDVALPIRWCAPETLHCTETTIETKEVTSRANVWSLGIVLWEICEFGKLPYSELTDDEVVLKVLGEGTHRLGLPSLLCPHRQNLFLLMKLCWSREPQRPALAQVLRMLNHLHSSRERQDGDDASLKTDEDFERRWEMFKPNTIPKMDNHSMTGSISAVQSPSPSLKDTTASPISETEADEEVRILQQKPLTLSHRTFDSSPTTNLATDLNSCTSLTTSPQPSLASSSGGEFFVSSLPQRHKSPSLQNLRGSIDDLSVRSLEAKEATVEEETQVEEDSNAETPLAEPDFDSWLKGVETTNEEDVKFVRKISEAIRDLDNTLALEKTSSSSSEASSKSCSHQQSPVKEVAASEQNVVLDFRLGQTGCRLSPGRFTAVTFEQDSIQDDSLPDLGQPGTDQDSLQDDSLPGLQRLGTDSGSDTEDETWRRRIEQGEFSQKVKEKSKSVADLMVLTHIDCSDSSDSDTPSLTWSFERNSNGRGSYTRQRNGPINKNLLAVSTVVFGSESNIHGAVLGQEFKDTLEKLQAAQRYSGKNLGVEPDSSLLNSVAENSNLLPSNNNKEINFLAMDASENNMYDQRTPRVPEQLVEDVISGVIDINTPKIDDHFENINNLCVVENCEMYIQNCSQVPESDNLTVRHEPSQDNSKSESIFSDESGVFTEKLSNESPAKSIEQSHSVNVENGLSSNTKEHFESNISETEVGSNSVPQPCVLEASIQNVANLKRERETSLPSSMLSPELKVITLVSDSSTETCEINIFSTDGVDDQDSNVRTSENNVTDNPLRDNVTRDELCFTTSTPQPTGVIQKANMSNVDLSCITQSLAMGPSTWSEDTSPLGSYPGDISSPICLSPISPSEEQTKELPNGTNSNTDIPSDTFQFICENRKSYVFNAETKSALEPLLLNSTNLSSEIFNSDKVANEAQDARQNLRINSTSSVILGPCEDYTLDFYKGLKTTYNDNEKVIDNFHQVTPSDLSPSFQPHEELGLNTAQNGCQKPDFVLNGDLALDAWDKYLGNVCQEQHGSIHNFSFEQNSPLKEVDPLDLSPPSNSTGILGSSFEQSSPESDEGMHNVKKPVKVMIGISESEDHLPVTNCNDGNSCDLEGILELVNVNNQAGEGAHDKKLVGGIVESDDLSLVTNCNDGSSDLGDILESVNAMNQDDETGYNKKAVKVIAEIIESDVITPVTNCNDGSSDLEDIPELVNLNHGEESLEFQYRNELERNTKNSLMSQDGFPNVTNSSDDLAIEIHESGSVATILMPNLSTFIVTTSEHQNGDVQAANDIKSKVLSTSMRNADVSSMSICSTLNSTCEDLERRNDVVTSNISTSIDSAFYKDLDNALQNASSNNFSIILENIKRSDSIDFVPAPDLSNFSITCSSEGLEFLGTNIPNIATDPEINKSSIQLENIVSDVVEPKKNLHIDHKSGSDILNIETFPQIEEKLNTMNLSLNVPIINLTSATPVHSGRNSPELIAEQSCEADRSNVAITHIVNLTNESELAYTPQESEKCGGLIEPCDTNLNGTSFQISNENLFPLKHSEISLISKVISSKETSNFHDEPSIVLSELFEKPTFSPVIEHCIFTVNSGNQLCNVTNDKSPAIMPKQESESVPHKIPDIKVCEEQQTDTSEAASKPCHLTNVPLTLEVTGSKPDEVTSLLGIGGDLVIKQLISEKGKLETCDSSGTEDSALDFPRSEELNLEIQVKPLTLSELTLNVFNEVEYDKNSAIDTWKYQCGNKTNMLHEDYVGGNNFEDELSHIKVNVEHFPVNRCDLEAESEEDGDEFGLDVAKHSTPDDERSSDSGFRDKGSLSESCEDACDEKYNLEDIEAELEETFNRGGFNYVVKGLEEDPDPPCDLNNTVQSLRSDETTARREDQNTVKGHVEGFSLTDQPEYLHPQDKDQVNTNYEFLENTLMSDADIFNFSSLIHQVKTNVSCKPLEHENLEKTLISDNEAETEDASLMQVTSRLDEGEGLQASGWFLHPPARPMEDEPNEEEEHASPKSASSTGSRQDDSNNSDNSYVSFSLDEEFVNAIRNELMEKLPCAQQLSGDEASEEETEEELPREEIVIHYNTYPAPLSPILEEGESPRSLSPLFQLEPPALASHEGFEEDIRRALESCSLSSDETESSGPGGRVTLEDLDRPSKALKVKDTLQDAGDDVLLVDTETNEVTLLESPTPKSHLAFVNCPRPDPELYSDEDEETVGINSETFVKHKMSDGGLTPDSISPDRGTRSSCTDASAGTLVTPDTDNLSEYFLTPSDKSPDGSFPAYNSYFPSAVAQCADGPVYEQVQEISLGRPNNEAAEIISELQNSNVYSKKNLFLPGLPDNQKLLLNSSPTSKSSSESDQAEMLSFEDSSEASDLMKATSSIPESNASSIDHTSSSKTSWDFPSSSIASPVDRLDYLTGISIHNVTRDTEQELAIVSKYNTEQERDTPPQYNTDREGDTAPQYNTEQEQDTSPQYNMDQEPDTVLQDNAEQERDTTPHYNTEQERDTTTQYNTKQEQDTAPQYNTEQERDTAPQYNTEQEQDTAPQYNTEQERDTAPQYNTEQELGAVSQYNTEQERATVSQNNTEHEPGTISQYHSNKPNERDDYQDTSKHLQYSENELNEDLQDFDNEPSDSLQDLDEPSESSEIFDNEPSDETECPRRLLLNDTLDLLKEDKCATALFLQEERDWSVPSLEASLLSTKAPMPSPEEGSWKQIPSMLAFSDLNDVIARCGEEEEAFGDISFTGPGHSPYAQDEDADLMSTSFSVRDDDADCYTPDWESESEDTNDEDNNSSSSGEFIWKEGDREESVKAVNSTPAKPYEGLSEFPMEVIAEEEEDDDDSASSESGAEFVPSAWNREATPNRSALRSPDKKSDHKKNVSFKRQKYHCVYEYPREVSDSESEGLDSPTRHRWNLYQPDVDYASYADWDLMEGDVPDLVGHDTDTDLDALEAPAPEQFDFYKLSGVDYDFGTGMVSEDGEFFISSSARPFHFPSSNSDSSQFFPGETGVDDVVLDFESPATDCVSTLGVDSGEDEVDTSVVALGSSNHTVNDTKELSPVPRKLSAVDVAQTPDDTKPTNTSKLRSLVIESKVMDKDWGLTDAAPQSPSTPLSPTSALGELRHTRDRLKLDLPPTNTAFIADTPSKRRSLDDLIPSCLDKLNPDGSPANTAFITDTLTKRRSLEEPPRFWLEPIKGEDLPPTNMRDTLDKMFPNTEPPRNQFVKSLPHLDSVFVLDAPSEQQSSSDLIHLDTNLVRLPQQIIADPASRHTSSNTNSPSNHLQFVENLTSLDTHTPDTQEQPLQDTSLPDTTSQNNHQPLQDTSLPETTPQNNHQPLQDTSLPDATQQDNHQPLQDTSLPDTTPQNNHQPLQDTSLPDTTPQNNHQPLQDTSLPDTSLLNNHQPLQDTSLPDTSLLNKQQSLQDMMSPSDTTQQNNHQPLQDTSLPDTTQQNNHQPLQYTSLPDTTSQNNHQPLQDTSLPDTTPQNNHQPLQDTSLPDTSLLNKQQSLQDMMSPPDTNPVNKDQPLQDKNFPDTTLQNNHHSWQDMSLCDTNPLNNYQSLQDISLPDTNPLSIHRPQSLNLRRMAELRTRGRRRSVEPIKGEASLLDSGEETEDSGIESSNGASSTNENAVCKSNYL